MSSGVEYSLNKSTFADVLDHLKHCDADFVPPLSGRVDIEGYAQKIVRLAVRFEAWSGDALIGLVAAYCNDQESRTTFVSSVSVSKAWVGQRIATTLMGMCVTHAESLAMRQVVLEVASNNLPAVELYRGLGFVEQERRRPNTQMRLTLHGKEQQ